MSKSTGKIYDFIIIGGGPAGSTAATYLSRNGFKVLVLEKEKFPRFHIGESLLPFCYHIFHELGVLEQMEKEFSRKPGATFSNIDNSRFSHWCFSKVIPDPSYLSFHVSRDRFDQILLDNAKINGSEVLEETKVTHVEHQKDDALVTIKTAGINKLKNDFQCRFLLDASGQNTFLGKKMGSKEPNITLGNRIAYYSHWENIKSDESIDGGNIRIVSLEGDKLGWIFLVPLGGNKVSIGVVLEKAYVSEKKGNKSGLSSKQWNEKMYLDELDSSPFIKELLVSANRLMEVHVTSDYSYNVKQKYDSWYALIGDASAFLDPIFSSGVYLAMKSALIISEAAGKYIKSEQGIELLDDAYQTTSGGYKVVEELINAYYEKDAIKFSEVDKMSDYDKYETVYSMLHLVLAGDFFNNYDKYIRAIETMKDKKKLDQYKNLVNNTDEHAKTMCK
jgi:flavin-dependent dehydrogenase